jgi:phosphate transport system substrate-binding protein
MFKRAVFLIAIVISTLMEFNISAKPPAPSQAFFKNSTGTIKITAPAELASMMRKVLFEICSTNNNLTGKVEEKDYAKALTELQQGKSDIVLVKRKPTYLAKTYNNWMIIPYASTAVVIIVKNTNKITSLKVADLPRIFGGATRRWKEFSGIEGGIHLIGLYAETSGGHIFRELVMGKEPISRYFFPVSTGSQVDIIISADKDAIGFRMYSDPVEDAKVKQLAINGIKPTPATITTGKYPLAISYYLCYNKKSKNPLVAKFIEYFKTSEFAGKIAEAGLIPPTAGKKK